MKRLFNPICALGLTILHLSFSALAQAYPKVWVGNYTYYSSRAPSALCGEQVLTDNKVIFNSWDRGRALVTNLCFEVYAEGLTDQGHIEPGELDIFVRAPYKFPARFVAKKGNNYLYLIDLRDMDPGIYGKSSSGNRQRELELRPIVNLSGAQLGGEGPIKVIYE